MHRMTSHWLGLVAPVWSRGRERGLSPDPKSRSPNNTSPREPFGDEVVPFSASVDRTFSTPVCVGLCRVVVRGVPIFVCLPWCASCCCAYVLQCVCVLLCCCRVRVVVLLHVCVVRE